MLEQCPHVTIEEHYRAAIGGTVVPMVIIGAVLLWKMFGGNKEARKGNSSKPYKMGVLDHLIGAVLVAIMCINIYTRISRGVGHWLVQVTIYYIFHHKFVLSISFVSPRPNRLLLL